MNWNVQNVSSHAEVVCVAFNEKLTEDSDQVQMYWPRHYFNDPPRRKTNYHRNQVPHKHCKKHFLLFLLRLRKYHLKLNVSSTIIVYFLIIQLLLLFPLGEPMKSFSSTTESSSQQHFKESGEPCTLDIECGGGLICARPERSSYSYCDCDNRNYTWSSKYQKCVGLVNTKCTNSITGDKLLCVDNAYCVIKPEIGVGICECSSSFDSTRERTCQLKYGYKCTNDNNENLCHKGKLLNCIDGTCRCQFPNQMKYDKELQQCRMLVSNPCHLESELEGFTTTSNHPESENIIGCVTGSKCVVNPRGVFGICVEIEISTNNKSQSVYYKKGSSTHYNTSFKEEIISFTFEERFQDQEMLILRESVSISTSTSFSPPYLYIVFYLFFAIIFL